MNRPSRALHAAERSSPHDIACEVMLDGMEVMADIGAYKAEYGVPQPLRIGVTLSVIPPCEDSLNQTFDYAMIRKFAMELAGQRICLIETFATRLAQMCLQADVVLEAHVRIDKPRAVPGCLAGAQVRLRKS